ncbi:MAG: ferrochelatase [Alphaproteobacteria bacterium]
MVNKRTAVVLLNLGGPDTQQAVGPFLYNLFSDPAIIPWPAPLRQILARGISALRLRKAQGIYAHLGGGSPILANTQKQAAVLSEELGSAYQVFVAMRYWHPFIAETVAQVKDGNFAQVILLPLYPQFSTTTTESSFREWHSQSLVQKLGTPSRSVDSYAGHAFFAQAYADLIRPQLAQAKRWGRPRLLLSAHGLPQSVVDNGDPYEDQVSQSSKAIVELLKDCGEFDWQICYQSRVGPKRWLKPSLDEALAQAQSPVVVVPISFVSEHSETLVELDITYAQKAKQMGIPFYGRVATVSCHPLFIKGLAALC